ncbi:MAG: tetratricopeptide repeat protein [Bryobacteraceae bacterium]
MELVTEEQRQRVSEVFADALEQQAEDRTAFVDRAVPDDIGVRDEVLRLIEEEKLLDSDWLRPVVFNGGAGVALRSGAHPAFTRNERVDGRYRIERLIDTGGMGEVYEAWDEKLQKRLALKTILPEIAGDLNVLERFRREVATALGVTHRNVCRVYDIGEDRSSDGVEIAFLTMEYLEGETLAERLQRCGPMTAEVALPLVRQMAAGLGAAHRAQVVHRDFKPGNVMLTPEADGGDRAVVTDFGLARSVRLEQEDAAATRPGLTRSGMVVGTPDYMAPELWSGGEAGPAADVYALGVVMFQMRTGRKPLRPRPADLTLEENWERVIGRCLAEDPGLRPETVEAVIAELDAPAAEAPVAVRKRRWNWWAVAASMIILTAVTLFSGRFRLTVQEAENGFTGRNVAVLPFRAGEPDLQVFSDGLMEAITQRLSQYEGMNQALVVTPASEMRRGNVGSAAEAKSKLGTNLAVEGTLQAQEGRLRLVMAVIDTDSMRQVESAVVEGSRGRALSLQDEAVSKLVRALDLRVQPEFAAELNRVSPVEPGAYEFYLQAKGYLQRNDRLTDIDSAVELLNRAIRLDPNDAASHAALGEAYWYKYERTSDSRWIKFARKECRRAIDLDPSLAAAHVTMGRIAVGTGSTSIAIGEFLTGLKADPRSADAYQGLARAYLQARKYEEAETTYRKAIELRPRDWRGYRELGMFYYRRSDLRGAIEQFEKVVQLTPDNASAYNNLGGFYGILGDRENSRRMLERALDLEPARVSALSNLTKILYGQGQYDVALARWRKAIDVHPNSFLLWGNYGATCEKRGSTIEAREAYAKAISLLDEAIAVNPTDRGLYSHRAHMFASLGDGRKAMADLARTDSLRAKDSEMLLRDALSYVRIKRLKESAMCLRQALSQGYSRDEIEKNEYLLPAFRYLETMTLQVH